MKNQKKRYAETERYITLALIFSSACFMGYLIAAGNGIVWLKVLFTIVAILLCGLCLVCLYFNQELLRPRSLWMSVGAASIIICILFSFIVNFPSPHPANSNSTADASSFASKEP